MVFRAQGKRKRKRKRAETESYDNPDDVNHLDAFSKDKPVFRRTFDRPQFSMDHLATLFPDADKCRVVDLYFRRRPITDRYGKRLQGTRPYDFDPNLPSYHALTKLQVEQSPGDWVTLCGVPAKDWFETIWGKITQQGQWFEIGGRMRRVYFMDHMEYLQKYAKKDRLDVTLRNLLRKMTKLSGVRTSEAWIDERIAKLRTSPPKSQGAEPRAAIRRDIVVRLSDAWTRKCPQHAKYMRNIRKTPEYRDKMRKINKARWQDEKYRSTTMAGMARSWEGNDERKAAMSDRSIRLWEDDNFRANQSASSAEMWTRPGFRENMVPKMAKSKTFHRDDSNPTMKKAWEKSVKSANDFAAGLKTGDLKFEFLRAFTVLHLDPSHYGVSMPPNFAYSNSSRGFAADFFSKAAAGSPWFFPDDIDPLLTKFNVSRNVMNNKVKTERNLWLRSAAVLRRKGIDVDFASIPHLAWMA